jgi:uncharacterized protein
MKNKLLIISLLVLTIPILGLAGCGTATAQTPAASSTLNTGSTPVNVNVNSQQGIWVSGQGTVSVTPDIAILNLGVSVQASKVADAQPQAAEAMAKVIASLTANGVDQKDISTQYYSISPLTKYDNNTQQSTITGYQVTNIVNAKIRTVDKVGAIIDAVTPAGGDATRINSISFSVDKPEQYYSQARTLAMNDAKVKAQELAKLAGVNLGLPFYINESTSSSPFPYDISVRAAGAPAATTPISPGQMDIVLSVQVAYIIQ